MLFGHMNLSFLRLDLPATPSEIRPVLHLLPIPTRTVEIVPLVHLVGTVVRFIDDEHETTEGTADTPMNIEPLRSALAELSRVVIGNLRLHSPTAPPLDMSTPELVMILLLPSALLNRDAT